MKANIIETLLDNLHADAPVRQVLIGAFWTAVVLNTEPVRCGLASTMDAPAAMQATGQGATFRQIPGK